MTSFPPANRCIYCGTTTQPLSDEHIIPFALGGELILPEASCQDCAMITGAVERRLLRGHLWPARVRLGLKSRRPKEQPSTFAGTLTDDVGSTSVDIDPDEYPGMIVFDFNEPAILRSAIDTGPPLATGVRYWLNSLAASDRLIHGKKIVSVDGKRELTLPVNMRVDVFARFLLKVAWAYAVATWGYDAFSDRFAPAIVRDEAALGATTYVGRMSGTIIVGRLPGSDLNVLMERRHGELASVCVQLLRETATAEPPIYEVVVGRLRTT